MFILQDKAMLHLSLSLEQTECFRFLATPEFSKNDNKPVYMWEPS